MKRLQQLRVIWLRLRLRVVNGRIERLINRGLKLQDRLWEIES